VYRNFAYVYDNLMADYNYPKWINYIRKIFDRCGVVPNNVVDLACGTGSITIGLADKGYAITGIDQSADMLNVAKQKARAKGFDIQFICQDIRYIMLHHPVDAITCMCDGFNYILSLQELEEAFENIYKLLNPGGILIFDISSYYKLSSILGSNTMVDTDNEISFIWQNHFDKSDKICQMELTFFVAKGDLYKRFDEVHFQRAYTREEIMEAIYHAGFDNVSCYHPFTFDQAKKRAHRLVFVAQR
jgi:ubiquinone/menaquinone biosynthesis C-methylase UbiE